MSKKLQKNRHSDALWLYNSEAGRWLMALLVSAVMLVSVFCVVHPVFMTIDDARLKYVFAGYSSGTPADSYLFSYYPLSFVLSKLYTWFPNFHWYGMYQFGVIGLSSALVGKTIYKIARRKNVSLCWAVLLHIWVYLSTALISTILMHFEITAAMAGTAGVILLLGLDVQKDKTAWKITDLIFSVLGIAASFVIQFNAFYAACCYLLVALVFLVLNGIRQGTLRKTGKHLACYFLCLAVAVAGVKLTENHAKDTPEWKAYLTYNKYRVSFWDYPHISYQDDPALFEEMGWTEEFYNLTQSMYFMDERFNEQNLAKFTQRFSWFSISGLEQMKDTLVQTMSDLFQKERLAVLQTGMGVLFALVFLVLLCKKEWRKQYYPQILSALCCIGGTVLVLLFLGARGRLPLRAWLACTIPCICLLTILLFMMVPAGKKLSGGKKTAAIAVAAVLAGIWLLGMGWSYDKIINKDRAWRVERLEDVIMMEQYACNNPDNVYVYDHMGAQNYSVFSIYPSASYRPTNAFVWGSSYLFTPVYEEQLLLNGLQSLTTEDLFREDVYFIGYSSGSYSSQLYAMLCREYGQVEMTPVDQIGDAFVVYHFNKVQE